VIEVEQFMSAVGRRFVVLMCLACTLACGHVPAQTKVEGAAAQPVALEQKVTLPFRFVAYGDTRFTDPSNTVDSNPVVRRALVQAIADSHPAFISIGGDISYKSDAEDWSVWDTETKVWRDQKVAVYPALGNHDLKGDPKTALHNYFQRFPDLKESRYYSARIGNVLMLVLDSSIDENSGPQADWLKAKLDALPADVDFVMLVMHHPPYTSSSDEKKFGGGHSARHPEQQLAQTLEARQQTMRARIVVFTGHVHNYERHEHGGITYFVTGGGGAHAYPIERGADDPFKSDAINYHYLLAEIDRGKVTVTMNRLEMKDGQPVWSQPDRVTITAAAAAGKAAGR
jgi:Icc-related predicted phosphoesterase